MTDRLNQQEVMYGSAESFFFCLTHHISQHMQIYWYVCWHAFFLRTVVWLPADSLIYVIVLATTTLFLVLLLELNGLGVCCGKGLSFVGLALLFQLQCIGDFLVQHSFAGLDPFLLPPSWRSWRVEWLIGVFAETPTIPMCTVFVAVLY
jgi:hypothetical protein